MAADYGKLTRELSRFYDFTDKVVLFVGVGEKQLLDLSIRARNLIAIDQDAAAIGNFRNRVASLGLGESVSAIAAPFEEVTASGDVVYFEFCLHEMSDPDKALMHARTIAPDIVIFDHSPGSDWTFLAAEEDKVLRSAEAMKHFGIRRRERYCTEQRFADYAELLAKLTGQGAVAIERAQRFKGTKDIVIPMSYELNLL